MEKEVKNKKKKGGKLKAVLTVFVAVAVVLLITVTGAQKLGNLTLTAMATDVKAYFMRFSAGDGYPYKLDSDKVKDIKINNSNLFLLLSDRTTVLTPTAKEIMPQEHKYSNPVMKLKGSKAIVYDLNSGRYRIQSGSQIIAEFEEPHNLMCAGIGKGGNYAVATYSDECQSVLTAYSKSRKKQFTYNFKSERVISISLSDNGKFIAVGAISADNGSIHSKLYIFNIGKSEVIKTFDYPSSMIVSVDYVSGNNICVICDNMRSYIRNNTARQNDIKFDSDTLHGYSSANNGAGALVLSRYGSPSLSSLTLYSSGNKAKFTVDFDNEAKWVSTDGKYTAVLFDNVIKTYNGKGKQIGEIYFDGEPVRVEVDSGKTYVLTSTGLNCFKTRGTTDERVTDNG